MNNIATIIRDDMKHLFVNSMSVIITIGLIAMPSLFAWYNILACWNVFDNTGNLTVAVANADEGHESDLVPLRVNIGDQVISALHQNDQINWVFTTQSDAVDGARSGRYYAAVVIPESFSRDMLTFYTDDMEHAKIYYYVNEKKNAIAPRITDRSADTVSYQINQVFAETISDIALGLAQTFAQYADEGDADGQLATLVSHLRQASERMDQTARVLQLYASLAGQSQGLLEGSAKLIDSTHDQVNGVMGSVEDGKRALSTLAGTISSSAYDLSMALESSESSLGQMQSQVEGMLDGAASDAGTIASGLRSQAAVLDAAIADYASVISNLQDLRAKLPAGRTETIDGAIASLEQSQKILQDARDSMISTAGKLESGNSDALDSFAQVKSDIDKAKQSIDTAKSDFEQNLEPGMQQLSADVQTLSGYLDRGVENLDAVGGDLAGSVGSVSSSLSSGTDKVNEASSNLQSTAKDIGDLAGDLEGALASKNESGLRDVLASDADDLSTALSAPVQIERTAVFPSENFGSAMSPLYTTLALFIGSLLIMVVVKPQVSERGREHLSDPKPRELFFGRFGVVAFISLMQSTITGLGNMCFLQVQVAHPLLFMVCFWASGLAFAFIVYTLVVSFENLGKAFAVLLLIIQVTGCGGSYPLQILPDFVQQVSPFLPATHVVNAMRSAMMGVYANDFWIEMGWTVLFIVPMLLLGLALRKPLERFMRFYISKVEDSKLVE